MVGEGDAETYSSDFAKQHILVVGAEQVQLILIEWCTKLSFHIKCGVDSEKLGRCQYMDVLSATSANFDRVITSYSRDSIKSGIKL